jgi:uncharacterized membrane protein YccC
MDIEKTMQFILDMQAKHEASIARHGEEMAELRASMKKHDEQIAANTEQIGKNAGQIGQLADLVKRIASANLVMADRLNSLVAALEKYALGRNGHSPTEQRS